MKRQQRSVSKKPKPVQPKTAAVELPKVPRSFVIGAGDLPRPVRSLVYDLRKVMEPNTATKLKEKKSNKIKDFVSMAGPLGVTHLIMLSKKSGVNLRIGRFPQGPTLMFRILSYTLVQDVRASVQKSTYALSDFHQAPLVVLNNFDSHESHSKLSVATFQHMFPELDVERISITDVKRVALFNYNRDTNVIEFRHYAVRVHSTGVTKGIKRILQTKIPNLQNLKDISEYVMREAKASESDVEESTDAQLAMETESVQSSTSNMSSQRVVQRAVRLFEIGPRMDLELVKIQEGLCDGRILYHALVSKTPEEEEELERRHAQRKVERDQRRRQQEENVRRKSKGKKTEEGDSDAEAVTADDIYQDEDETADHAEEEMDFAADDFLDQEAELGGEDKPLGSNDASSVGEQSDGDLANGKDSAGDTRETLQTRKRAKQQTRRMNKRKFTSQYK